MKMKAAVLREQGKPRPYADSKPMTIETVDLDPPGPMPWRCFDLGRALARIITPGPWRVALVASASWSHSFLASGTSYFHPAVEADRLAIGIDLPAELCGDHHPLAHGT